MSHRTGMRTLSTIAAAAVVASGWTPSRGGPAGPAPEPLELLAHVDPHPGRAYGDCWGYTAPDGRRYALLGVEHGTSIVDVTEPEAAREVVFVPGAVTASRDVQTYGDYAYVVTESPAQAGVQIVDLSRLPDDAPIAAVYTGFAGSHSLFVDVEAEVLYADRDIGLDAQALSLKDPLAPEPLSSFGPSWVDDVFVRDGLAVLSNVYEQTFELWDVADPGAPASITEVWVPGLGPVHASWIDESGRYWVTTELATGASVKMWDLAELDDIELIDEYRGPHGRARRAYLHGGFAYVTHGSAGLRVVDAADPTALVETAWLDTTDAFGAYPLFDTGDLLVSDSVDGLYVAYFEGAVDPLVATELSDPAEPIVIPPEGGEFSFSMSFTNRSRDSQTIDTWAVIEGPTGTIGPVFGPTVLTLPAGSERGRLASQSIPGSYAAGRYEYVSKVGRYPDTVYDSDVIEFRKLHPHQSEPDPLPE